MKKNIKKKIVLKEKKKKRKDIYDVWVLADKIITEDFGIGVNFTDIYLACPIDFNVTEKQWKKIEKKYKIDDGYLSIQSPMALIAMNILDK